MFYINSGMTLLLFLLIPTQVLGWQLSTQILYLCKCLPWYIHFVQTCITTGIFLPIYPGPLEGPVPNAKKYIFFSVLMKLEQVPEYPGWHHLLINNLSLWQWYKAKSIDHEIWVTNPYIFYTVTYIYFKDKLRVILTHNPK